MSEQPRKNPDFRSPKIEGGDESNLTMAELIKKLKEGKISGKISENDIAEMKKLQNPKEFRAKIEGLLDKIERKTEGGDK